MKQKVNDSNSPDNQERGIRLQVVLARSGVASRRSAESIIGEGRVRVNGAVVTEMGTRVSEEDEILLDGKPVLRETRKLYILLNKPAGYVSSMADDQNRPIAADLLKEAFPERVYNVGRLDMYSPARLSLPMTGTSRRR
jgi:23S rRNA pseudouridine2605 synthase